LRSRQTQNKYQSGNSVIGGVKFGNGLIQTYNSYYVSLQVFKVRQSFEGVF
jgi:hypothetical protein